MALRQIFSRPFILTFLAQFGISSVSSILVPTLPIYLSNKGSTEVEIGLLIGVLGISSLVLRPFVGRILTRVSERTFMVWGAALFALTSFAYLLAPPFWPFLLVRIVQGFAVAFFYTASVLFIANISSEEHRGRSLTYFYTAFNLAFALAPSCGMWVINLFGFIFLFSLCAAMSLTALLVTTHLPKRENLHEGTSPLAETSLVTGRALPPAVMSFIAHVIWGAVMAFYPIYALECGVSNPGLFFAAFAIVLILGRTVGGSILDRLRRETLILPCMLATVLAMALLAFAKTLPMMILAAVIWALGGVFLYPSLVLWSLDLAGPARGPVMGTFSALQDLGTGLGPVIMGLVLRWTDYPTLFLCLALAGVANVGYFCLIARRGKEAR